VAGRSFPSSAPLLALALLLLLGGALRFIALDSGLRHPPHADERVIVGNVERMLAARDFDHRYYQYPGLFFYVLRPVLARVAPSRFGASAYLAARAVVAGLSVICIALAFVLGRALGGGVGGVLAAGLVACSPIEVRTAHMVRPDVALECFALVALLTQRRIGARLRDDAAAGVALGAATAVKFTGALLLPGLVAKRLAAPGARWRGLVAALASAALGFCLLSPYTLLAGSRSFAGLGLQLGYFYTKRSAGGVGWGGLMAYSRYFHEGLGAPAAVVAVWGSLLALWAWRENLHLVLWPLATVLAYSTSVFHQERYILPTLGVVAALAGIALAAVARRSAVLALALGVLCLAQPLASSLAFVAALRQPLARDLAAAWIESNLPAGTRILVQRSLHLGLPPRFEMLKVRRLSAAALPRADVAVVPAQLARLPGVESRVVFETPEGTPFSGRSLRVLQLLPAPGSQAP
jgi:4-amino-4-deoxy-L-arabinose transferase-like glycosyltransferase